MSQTDSHVTTPPWTVVYILGSGHCGSTLLNLLLNGHSQMIGLSELDQLRQSLHPGDDAATAERLAELGPFWQEVAWRFQHEVDEPLHQMDLSRVPVRKMGQWAPLHADRFCRTNQHLFAAIHAVSGAQYLVDASKGPHRLAQLARCESMSLRVIHLQRDGRAVVNSYRRKYGRFGQSLRRWGRVTLAAAALRRSFPPERWTTVRYEQLAVDPEATLLKLCDWLSVEYEPAMLRFHDHEHVGIGGNRMRRSGDDTIRFDERWRRELSRFDRLRFALLGGWLNKFSGY